MNTAARTDIAPGSHRYTIRLSRPCYRNRAQCTSLQAGGEAPFGP